MYCKTSKGGGTAKNISLVMRLCNEIQKYMDIELLELMLKKQAIRHRLNTTIFREKLN